MNAESGLGRQGLGCMGMSEFYGPTDVAEANLTLEAALASGVTLFDTADSYGSGANETFLGPFLRRHRDQVVIATKCGLVRRRGDPSYRGVDNSPAYLVGAVEASLRRLGVDRLDLVYLHRIDPAVDLADTVGALAGLVTAGTVGRIGLCEIDGDQLRTAHAVHPIAAVQSEWSLVAREVEATLVPAAVELRVPVVGYAPLGRGLLTGRITDPARLSPDDARRRMPRFVAAEHNQRQLAPLTEIAAERGATPAQVALAWLYLRADELGVVTVPIPGSRTRTRLRQNLAAVDLTLTAAECGRLDPLAGRMLGSRSPGVAFTPASG